MKNFLLLITAIFFLFSNVNAQLVAEAGNDTLVCAGFNVVFGGSPTASGGMAPYTYAWTGPWNFASTLANPSESVIAGTYYVLVTDSLGAQATDSAVVTCYPNPIFTVGISPGPYCTGVPIQFFPIVSGGTPPYTFDWGFTHTNPPTTFAIDSPILVVNSAVPVGGWGATADANGCLNNDALNITVQFCGNFSVSSQDVLCFGMCNGSATVSPQGNYRYQWSSGSTSATDSSLCAGTYTVTVMDAAFAPLDTLTVNIMQPTQFSVVAVATPISCFGLNDGAINTFATGGTLPYTYMWSPGITVPNPTNLAAGTYVATITDANGCSASAMASVTMPPLLVVSTSAVDASGCGVCDGSATVTVNGGTNPYAYLWSNNAVTPVLNNLCPGVYICTITDFKGCSDTTVATVNATGSTLNVSTTVSHVTCSVNSGSLSASVTGGVPPYSFEWNTGDTTTLVSGLAAGLYTVSVTDSSGCAGFAIDTVLDLRSYNYYVFVSATNTNCGINGTATAQPQGGVPPFTYIWNTTPAQTTATATGLVPGTYSVSVTDSAGCQRTGTVQIINGGCNNVIEGIIFHDVNGNCVLDSSEGLLPAINIRAVSGSNVYYGLTDNAGHYSIRVSVPGNFNVDANVNNGWGNCSSVNSCGTQTVSFTGLGDTASLNFGFSASPGFNLVLHPGWHTANPGFQKDYWILYNQTSMPIYTGPADIVFKYDSILVYQSSNNSGVHDAAAHTITWTVSSVPYPSWNWNTLPRAIFTVPANTPIGYQLSQEFWITPTAGDCDTSNNHLLFIQPVTGSMDPNEKHVEPAGDILEEDSVLTYTIHFQNTGNDTTWFVILKDTLSPHLNAATVQNLSSSHEYTSFDISDNGILTWLFNPIFLVDSATNESASKGYVMFKVKKKAGLPLTTQISNKASIYFDYNEPIVTNTVTNTLTEPNFIFTVRGDDNISVMAMPNPFTQQTQIVVEGINSAFDFELFDVTGKVMKKISSVTENHFELQREDMSTGVYFYRITTTQKQRAFGRVVVE